jgi:hypothetical protein
MTIELWISSLDDSLLSDERDSIVGSTTLAEAADVLRVARAGGCEGSTPTCTSSVEISSDVPDRV